MIGFWMIGALICWAICSYIVLRRERSKWWVCVLSMLLFAVFSCVLSWLGIMLMLAVIGLSTND